MHMNTWHLHYFFRFSANSHYPERGFNITYSEFCGGVFKQNGELMSPNFPFAARNYDCTYILSQTDWAVNKLQIDQFDLGQWDEGCKFSFLEIRDGNNESSPLMGRFCGKLTDINSSLISTQNEVRIRWIQHNKSIKNSFLRTEWVLAAFPCVNFAIY